MVPVNVIAAGIPAADRPSTFLVTVMGELVLKIWKFTELLFEEDTPLRRLRNCESPGQTLQLIDIRVGQSSHKFLILILNVNGDHAVFSSDEKSVFAIVDTSGENEIWKYAADGSGKGEQLTTQGDNHRWKLYPSPDGRWLAHTDKKGRFWLLDLASKRNQLIDDAGKAGVDKHDEVQWSPDSRNLAHELAGLLEHLIVELEARVRG